MAANTDVTLLAPESNTSARSWKEFIRSHQAMLAGTDFFTVEVFTLQGLVTFYVLFFIIMCCSSSFSRTVALRSLGSRRIPIKLG